MSLMVRSGGTVWRTVMSTPNLPAIIPPRRAWNRGRIVGQKRPLQPKHVWAIRVRLEPAENKRDLALFNMAVDSKLRGCDLVKLLVKDVLAAGHLKERTSILQTKTAQPVQFEISEGTRRSLRSWIDDPAMTGSDFLWPGRFHDLMILGRRLGVGPLQPFAILDFRCLFPQSCYSIRTSSQRHELRGSGRNSLEMRSPDSYSTPNVIN